MDAQWDRIGFLPPGTIRDPGRRIADNRLLVFTMLYVIKTGLLWAAPTERFDRATEVWKRYDRWSAPIPWNSSPGRVELPTCTDAELGSPEMLITMAVPMKVS